MSLVVAVLVFIAGVVSATLMGGRLRGAFGRLPLLPVERLLLDQAAGLSLIALAGTLLGFAGAFHAPVLAGLLFAGLLADPKRLARLPRELAAAAANLLPRSMGEWAAACGIGLCLTVTLIGALLPQVFYDVVSYQLGLPAQALLTGHIDIQPSVVQSAYPASFGVLLACHLAAGGQLAAQLFAWWGLAGASVAVVLLARRLGSRRRDGRPALASLILVSVPGLGIAATTTTIDHGLLFLASVSLLALAVYRRVGGGAAIVLAALPVGTMVGSKYTAAYFLIGAMVLLLLPPLRRGAATALRHALLFAALALVLASPWYLRAYAVLDNPVYPAFSAELGQGPDAIWAERQLARERTSFERSPRGAWLALGEQLLGTSGLNWGAEPGWLLPLVLLALVVACFPRSPLAGLRPWLALLVVVWLLWFSLQPGARYLFPVYPIAAIAIATMLGAPLRSHALLRGPLLLLLSLAIALNLAQVVHVVTAINGGLRTPSAIWSALTDREAHLDRVLDHRSAARWLNDSAPAEGRVLLLGETRILYFERPLVYSSAYDRHLVQRWMEQEMSAEHLLQRMRAEGVTHVLINWFEVERLGRSTGHLQLRADEERVLLTALDGMTRVYAEGRVEVRELPPTRPAR